MKTNTILTLGILILGFLSCGERKKGNGAVAENAISETLETHEGTAKLTLDGQTYAYDDIDWEKTRVKYDGEDVRLTLRQERLPRVKFRFPNIHESLGQQSEFKIPDVLRGGKSGGYFNSPITLSFQVYKKPDDRYPTKAVSFHKGKLTASFVDGRLKVAFDGEGRTVLADEKKYFPVHGTIDINIK